VAVAAPRHYVIDSHGHRHRSHGCRSLAGTRVAEHRYHKDTILDGECACIHARLPKQLILECCQLRTRRVVAQKGAPITVSRTWAMTAAVPPDHPSGNALQR
jgi:hypothetical protein